MNKFLRFLFTGLMVYVINLGCTYMLQNVFFMKSGQAYFFSILFTTIYSFFLSLYFTFRKAFCIHVFVKYIVFLLLLSSINYIVTTSLSHTFGNLYIIIFIVTTVLFFIKFYIYNRFVFIHKNL